MQCSDKHVCSSHIVKAGNGVLLRVSSETRAKGDTRDPGSVRADHKPESDYITRTISRPEIYIAIRGYLASLEPTVILMTSSNLGLSYYS